MPTLLFQFTLQWHPPQLVPCRSALHPDTDGWNALPGTEEFSRKSHLKSRLLLKINILLSLSDTACLLLDAWLIRIFTKSTVWPACIWQLWLYTCKYIFYAKIGNTLVSTSRFGTVADIASDMLIANQSGLDPPLQHCKKKSCKSLHEFSHYMQVMSRS